MADDARKTVTFKSTDGDEFIVPETVAMQFHTIRHLIVNNYNQYVIQLCCINSSDLEKVIEYCSKHVSTMAEKSANMASSDEEIKKWEADFVETNTNVLLPLMNAGYTFGIQDLVELTRRRVANLLKEKRRPGEVYRMLNTTNDYSPVEEEEMLSENPWPF